MLTILSPTKTMNPPQEVESYGTEPRFIKDTQKIISNIKKLKVKEVGNLMTMSKSITENTYQQYQELINKPSEDNLSSAVLTYSGESYKAMAATQWNKTIRKFADDHLCIISGLYGMLRPSDLIQPYRLEMAAKTKEALGQTLYQFWSKTITQQVNTQLDNHKNKILINLASQEYRKVISKDLAHPVVNIEFKEERSGKLKVISFNAKRARGLMTNFIISNRIDTLAEIKKFDQDEYKLHESSNESTLLFVR